MTEPLNPEVETNPGISSSSRSDQETPATQASTSSPNYGTGASPYASPTSARQDERSFAAENNADPGSLSFPWLHPGGTDRVQNLETVRFLHLPTRDDAPRIGVNPPG